MIIIQCHKNKKNGSHTDYYELLYVNLILDIPKYNFHSQRTSSTKPQISSVENAHISLLNIIFSHNFGVHMNINQKFFHYYYTRRACVRRISNSTLYLTAAACTRSRCCVAWCLKCIYYTSEKKTHTFHNYMVWRRPCCCCVYEKRNQKPHQSNNAIIFQVWTLAHKNSMQVSSVNKKPAQQQICVHTQMSVKCQQIPRVAVTWKKKRFIHKRSYIPSASSSSSSLGLRCRVWMTSCVFRHSTNWFYIIFVYIYDDE